MTPRSAPTTPRPLSLSVVVAAHRLGDAVAECVDTLGPQCLASGAECLLVVTGRRPSRSLIEQVTPAVRVIDVGHDALTPMLWTYGIRESRGAVVALTTADCMPRSDWVERIATAPWDEIAALGGSFELADGAPARSAAIFYQRYSAYLSDQSRRWVDDVAADNAAYRRDCLDQCAETWAAGFWEPDVHRELRGRGQRLLFDPALSVSYRHRGRVREMARQRYLHGWWFGGRRVTGAAARTRLLRVASTPAVPFVLLGRILRRLAAHPRLSVRLIPALPLLWFYVLCWSCGELRGYVQGPPDRPGC